MKPIIQSRIPASLAPDYERDPIEAAAEQYWLDGMSLKDARVRAFKEQRSPATTAD